MTTEAAPPDRRTDQLLPRWSAVALVGVGVLFVALVNAVATVHNPFSTDEVDYLVQVTPANPHLIWSAVRAWGVPVLAAPVALFSPTEAVIRLYMSIVLGAGLVAAFWTWRRVVHPVVPPLAGLLFATVFTTTLYGNGVMPNLPVALLAVAVTGQLARLPQARRRRLALVGLAVSFAVLALFRPTDSLLVSLPALACLLAFRQRRRLDTIAAVVVGEILGWLPWFVESYITFAGPVARWKAGSESGINGLHFSGQMFDIYPRLFPKMAVYCCYGAPATTAGPRPSVVVAWFAAVPILAVLGLVAAARLQRLADVAPVVLSAAAFTVFYLVLLNYGSPRFVLPILALLSIPVALGLVWAVTATPKPLQWVTAACCLLVVCGHLALQADYDATKGRTLIAERRSPLEHAIVLRGVLSPGPPCLVLGRAPQVTAYYLRCHIAVIRPPFRRPPAALENALARHWSVVAVKPGPHVPPSSYLATWHRQRMQPRGFHPFYAFTPSAAAAKA